MRAVPCAAWPEAQRRAAFTRRWKVSVSVFGVVARSIDDDPLQIRPPGFYELADRKSFLAAGLRPVARPTDVDVEPEHKRDDYIGGFRSQGSMWVRLQCLVCRRLRETLRVVKVRKAAVASTDRGIIATRVGRGL